MRSILKTIILVLVMTLSVPVSVWSDTIPQSDQEVTETATTATDSLDDGQLEELVNDTSLIAATPTEAHGFHKSLKTKFIEGNAGFMSLVALALVLGLAFCIERMIYLSLSEIDDKKFIATIKEGLSEKRYDDVITACDKSRGPVPALCRHAVEHIDEDVESIERSLTSYGSVLAAGLEKGCSWITLFIAMAPSLGFLGTVIGMVMAFDQIQQAGDISPTIVASGMKVALITTIFGIIVALILQLFYNYILTKIENLTAQMENTVISLTDTIIASREK